MPFDSHVPQKKKIYIYIHTQICGHLYRFFYIYFHIFRSCGGTDSSSPGRRPVFAVVAVVCWDRRHSSPIIPATVVAGDPPPTSPTPLSRRVAARCSLILIMRLSLERRPGAANTGAPSSSASNQSNKVLLLRSSSSKEDNDDREELGVSQVILIQPYLIFIIKLVQLLIEGRISWPPRAFALVKTGWFKTKKRTDRAALRGESADEGIAG